MALKTFSDEELGDFQTPNGLVRLIVNKIKAEKFGWGRILEPTCGTGAFISELMKFDEIKEIKGIEIQDVYFQKANAIEKMNRKIKVDITKGDIFSIHLSKDLAWDTNLPLLVIGNPPWVTSAKIGGANGVNLPVKSNIKKLNGLDALTGASNFDISEYILLKIVTELKEEKPAIAMLCKTNVARNVILFCQLRDIPVSEAKIFKIDAKKWFDASTAACLFLLKINTTVRDYDVEVYGSIEDKRPINKISIQKGRFVSDAEKYAMLSALDGNSHLSWRQGVKHDCAAVVELTRSLDGNYVNKLGEIVDVEDEYIYPFLKSSDLNGGVLDVRRWILMPQKKLHEDTSKLRNSAPKLWKYLNAHSDSFQRRKSSIYKNKPEFTYFGLGEYTFSKYKVAVSGIYKEPKFCVLGCDKGKPIIVDDTCYFAECNDLADSERIVRILNSKIVLEFLKSITFRESMRVLTKKTLQRVDLKAAEIKLGVHGAV